MFNFRFDMNFSITLFRLLLCMSKHIENALLIQILFHSDKASSRLPFLHLQASKRYGLVFEKLFKLSILFS